MVISYLQEVAMRIVSGLIIRQIIKETVAVLSGASVHSLSGLVALNETAAFLLDFLHIWRCYGITSFWWRIDPHFTKVGNFICFQVNLFKSASRD